VARLAVEEIALNLPLAAGREFGPRVNGRTALLDARLYFRVLQTGLDNERPAAVPTAALIRDGLFRRQW
jgi:hypothetical protein